jgi:hypothetical protein
MRAASAERGDIERHEAVAALGREALQARFEGAAPAALYSASCKAATIRRYVWRARTLVDIGFPGYAIGGLAVGEPTGRDAENRFRNDAGAPADQPHYLMESAPDDLLQSIARGVDMFDCVMPTRNGRHGLALRASGRSTSRMRITPTIRARSIRKAAVPRRAFLPRLFASSVPQRGARRHAPFNRQSFLLSGPDGGSARAVAAGRFADFAAETKDQWATKVTGHALTVTAPMCRASLPDACSAKRTRPPKNPPVAKYAGPAGPTFALSTNATCGRDYAYSTSGLPLNARRPFTVPRGCELARRTRRNSHNNTTLLTKRVGHDGDRRGTD